MAFSMLGSSAENGSPLHRCAQPSTSAAGRAAAGTDYCRCHWADRRYDSQRASWVEVRMSPGAHTEQAFEDRVEEELLGIGAGDAGVRVRSTPSWASTPGRCSGSSGRRRQEVGTADRAVRRRPAHRAAAVRPAGRGRDRRARGARRAASGGQGPGRPDRPGLFPARSHPRRRCAGRVRRQRADGHAAAALQRARARATRSTWRCSSTGCPSPPSS